MIYDDIELSDSDASEDEDEGDASYLTDSPLDASELFSLSETVDETLVASASLKFNHCQCYFGFSRVRWCVEYLEQ